MCMVVLVKTGLCGQLYKYSGSVLYALRVSAMCDMYMLLRVSHIRLCTLHAAGVYTNVCTVPIAGDDSKCLLLVYVFPNALEYMPSYKKTFTVRHMAYFSG